MKHLTRFLLLLISVITASVVSFSQSNSPVITRGAYLQQVTSHSIIIRWRTNPAATSKVEFGTSIDCTTSVTLTDYTSEHIVLLSNLEPGTKYFYRIGTATQTLQGDSLNYFYTAPLQGSSDPVRIWVTGDFGVGSAEQAAVRDAYSNNSNTPTNLWIWLGDNAYWTGTDDEYKNNVFNMYPDQLKHFPLYPTPGNHDYAQSGYQSPAALTTNFPYFNIFTVPQNGEAGGVPSGTPKYYSYNYSNIHCISLDSYGSLNYNGSTMYNWLVADLAANTQRWTIVYFHHPPFSKGTHDSDREIELIDMRTHIVPLIESYKVDLVLCGHSHSNERSYLIKGHYSYSGTFDASMMMSFNTNQFIKQVPYYGTVYAVCGTSGQIPGAPQPDGPMPCMYFNDYSSNCSMVIDVDGENLSARFLTANGTIADEFSIYKPGPAIPVHSGSASCEINYQTGNEMVYISMYLSEKAAVNAGLYNLNGEKIMDFPQTASSLNSGYHVLSAGLAKCVHSNGIYLVKVLIGDELFSEKLFIKVD